MIPKIVVVDDDATTRLLLETHLSKSGYDVHCDEDAAGLRETLQRREFDLLLLDIYLPDGNGIELIDEIHESLPDLPIIIITAYGSIECAVDAMRKGAYDFCPKPIDFNRINVSVKNALDHSALKKEVTTFKRACRNQLCDLIGGSPEMQVVFQIIETVAPTNAPVMITGESGTGKELVARAIHKLSPRKNRELIDVNCAAIPKELMESELFGHERHAFTGANNRYLGRCERAHETTLFLDEVSEMDINLQAKLLRFLQDFTFYRVGGKEKIVSDTRIISATNREPLEAIKSNFLREDLYYRLNVVRIPVPPLRERSEDIPILTEHFIKKYSELNGKRFQEIDTETLDVLCVYSWPGNVRELENCIHQAVVLNDGLMLQREMLPEPIRSTHTDVPDITRLGKKNKSISSASTSDSSAEEKIIPLEYLERKGIEEALAKTNGSVAKAAAGLRVSPATLYRKMREYNLKLKRNK
ncbi:MAG: sigma-54-dependent Fis family transcriptional regulator [Candidatus Omnitrophota bacterium]|jgi:two-component system repressor protein LuxO|nr:MAG: sigma-54-dependent Fis family transcriptional regulator [Candidatus Omnitrophota bacterium]